MHINAKSDFNVCTQSCIKLACKKEYNTLRKSNCNICLIYDKTLLAAFENKDTFVIWFCSKDILVKSTHCKVRAHGDVMNFQHELVKIYLQIKLVLETLKVETCHWVISPQLSLQKEDTQQGVQSEVTLIPTNQLSKHDQQKTLVNTITYDLKQ